jgi:hypothetical protein
MAYSLTNIDAVIHAESLRELTLMELPSLNIQNPAVYAKLQKLPALLIRDVRGFPDW